MFVKQDTLAGSLILLVALFVYKQTDAMGFPDGHLTELDRALRPLGYVFVSISVVVGVVLLLAGKRANTPKTAAYSRTVLLVYALILLLLLAIRVYLGHRLDDGVGG